MKSINKTMIIMALFSILGIADPLPDAAQAYKQSSAIDKKSTKKCEADEFKTVVRGIKSAIQDGDCGYHTYIYYCFSTVSASGSNPTATKIKDFLAKKGYVVKEVPDEPSLLRVTWCGVTKQ
jgi:hypothetical protein